MIKRQAMASASGRSVGETAPIGFDWPEDGLHWGLEMVGDLQATAPAHAQDGHMAFVSCRPNPLGRIADTHLNFLDTLARTNASQKTIPQFMRGESERPFGKYDTAANETSWTTMDLTGDQQSRPKGSRCENHTKLFRQSSLLNTSPASSPTAMRSSES